MRGRAVEEGRPGRAQSTLFRRLLFGFRMIGATLDYDKCCRVSPLNNHLWPLIPGSEYIRDLVRRGTISPGAAARLRWMDHYSVHDNARLTCRQQGIRLFVIPPRSPKLQGYVERSNRTHREECYEVEDIEPLLEGHNQQLEAWNKIYHDIRPHQSLGYQTPHEFYSRWLKEHKKTKYH
jgi:hypothetical protein